MSPEKEDALVKDFPHLFRDTTAPLTHSLMGFGFEHGDGWEPIIRKAASQIEPIITKLMDDAIKAGNEEALQYIPAASQVKEKYGTLRFYMTFTTDEIEKIIEEAENESEKTCEKCSKPGELRGISWYMTYCDDCWKEYRKKHE